MQAFLDRRDGQALGGHVLDQQLEAVLGAETLHHSPRRRRGAGNGQIDVQAGDVIFLAGQLQHQGQGVLAAGKGHQNALVAGEELLAFNAARHLAGEEILVAVRAEGGIVAFKGHGRRSLADFTLHGCPEKGWRLEQVHFEIVLAVAGALPPAGETRTYPPAERAHSFRCPPRKMKS